MPHKGENIFKRKDGRWEARYIKGYHEDGTAIFGYLYAASYTEVREKRNTAIAEAYSYMKPKETNPAPITISTLLNEWLAEQKHTVKESTYTRYYLLIEKHIKPALGGLKLKQLSNAHIERLSGELTATGRLDGTGGLSAKMVKDILSVVKLVIRYAEHKKYIAEGSIHVAETRSKKCEIIILSAFDRVRLEKYVSDSDDPCKFGVLLCLYTGIRIGEVCALRWENIDFINASLNVTSTIQRITDTDKESAEKTKLIFQEPKTESSVRSIPLPLFLLAQLKRLSAGRAKSDFVLSGGDTPVEPRSYSYKYKKYLAECGAGDYTFHSLRHPYVKPTTKKYDVRKGAKYLILQAFLLHLCLVEKKSM